MKYFSKTIILCCLLVIIIGCARETLKDKQLENNTFGSYEFFHQLFKEYDGSIRFYGCFKNQISVGGYVSSNKFINMCKEQFALSEEFIPETNCVFKLPLYRISSETWNMEHTFQDMSLNGIYMTLEEEKQTYTISACYQERNFSSKRTRSMIFIKYKDEK